jgi:hypothetical protein
MGSVVSVLDRASSQLLSTGETELWASQAVTGGFTETRRGRVVEGWQGIDWPGRA